MKQICSRAGMSRQNYYKLRKQRLREKVDKKLIEDLVRSERKLQPRIGGLKLHWMLQSEFNKAGIKIGRDRFFRVLKERELLVSRLPRGPQTTCSAHNLPVYGNKIRDVEVTHPNQIWVADITYIRTDEGFAYLSLITDVYSHKIVGWHLGSLMSTEETLYALKMALREKPKSDHPIHHSDRGSQYCSYAYVEKIESAGMIVSMTEKNHCAENAMAERMNGILKQEYGLGNRFRTKAQALRSVTQAVSLYNYRRPHLNLQKRIPGDVHDRAA